MLESTPNLFGRIEQLMEALDFTRCSEYEYSAMGDLSGIPTSFTVLGDEFLSLMFQFRIHPDESDPPQIVELLAGFPEKDVSFSVENKYLWLSLYHLDQTDVDELAQLITTIADRVQASSYRVAPGCLKCGVTDSGRLLYADGRPTRACNRCLTEASLEQQTEYTTRNRPLIRSAIGLPFMAAVVAIVWASFWTVIDEPIELAPNKVSLLNPRGGLLIFFAGAVLSAVVGWKTGKVMRRHAAVQRSPKVKIGLFLLESCVCGEILFLATRLVQVQGVFNLLLAAQLLRDSISKYTINVIVGKSLMIAVLYLSCYDSAILREEVELDL